MNPYHFTNATDLIGMYLSIITVKYTAMALFALNFTWTLFDVLMEPIPMDCDGASPKN
ncbi:MAG: hypothetical protein DID91_2727703634 [Candidatus Nitrotoga sp. MKT]|nr:MAG: hypothetical protein DID91_2727703634 [Candidatus Nitrotoga sp. MKT]